MTLIVLLVVLVVVSNATKEPVAEPTFSGPTVITGATATKVKDACVAHVKTVAVNAGREIAGVKPKFYTIGSTSFSGDVEEVSMLRDKLAYRVDFTYQSLHKDGTIENTTRVCSVDGDFGRVELRRP